MYTQGREKKTACKNALGIRCVALSLCWLFSLQATASSLASFHEVNEELQSGQILTLTIPEKNSLLLQIQNDGIDTIATALDGDGNIIGRSGTWRDREGRYLLLLSNENADALTVEISSSQRYAAAGNVILTWPQLDLLSISAATAIQQFALGMNRHMAAHFSAENDEHLSALQAYQMALSGLSQSQHADLRADIYFEMGVVYRHLGQNEEARNSYLEALYIFKNLNNSRGKASVEKELGLIARSQGNRDEALAHYQNALSIRLANDDYFFAARELNNIGVTEWASDNYQSAIDAYLRALPLLAGEPSLSSDEALRLSAEQIGRKGDLSETVNTINNLAVGKAALGEVNEAVKLWESSLRLLQETEQFKRAAQSMLNLGQTLIDQGILEAALGHIEVATDTFIELGDDYWVSEALRSIGTFYAAIDQHEDAIHYFHESLSLSNENQLQKANALSKLALSNWKSGNESVADTLFKQAYESFSDGNQLASAAVVESRRAMMWHEQGRSKEALDSHNRSIQVLQSVGHAREIARAQSRFGQLLMAEGQTEQATKQLQAALEGHRAVNDELFELDTLTALSRAQTGVASLDTARTATELADRIRMRTSSPGIQASFLASRRSAFEQYVDLLADSGDIEQAWAVSEQIRARNLLDLIQTGDVDGEKANQIIEQRNSLLADLAAASKMGDSTALSNLRREIDLLNGQLRSSRSNSSLHASLQTPLKLYAIQNQLGSNAAMLSYFIGEKRSHLWLIEDGAIVHHELPGADNINSIANELTQVLRSHRQSPSRIAYIAGQLSDVVLAPVMDDIKGRDLVVVADGSLQLVPFALLPMGGDRSLALVDNSTVTYSPSAQIFNLLGNSMQLDPTAGIVVLADPLTTKNQLALQNSSAADQFTGPQIDFDNLVAQRSLSQSGVSVAALPGARLEAAAIEKAVHNAGVNQSEHSLKILTGVQANQQFVEGGGLNGYSVVHFATHGVIDADLPELSGLILTQDAENNEVSYLRPHQIAVLNLDADLVVLSGCETGIGKSIGSEGSLSLSRPFLVAGAKQVVSSLWQVSDRATAVLMERFYFHLLKENQSAELALRSAQQWMREQSQWEHPYFWAGFVVQGGRNMPEIKTVIAEQQYPVTTLAAKLAAGTAL